MVPESYPMLSSVQIQGLRPVVRKSKDLEQEFIAKAADDPTWQELYDKAKKDRAIDGEVLANIS